MKQPVIVTGANGFIGRYTSRFMAQRGWAVLGIGHGDWDESEWRSWGLSDWFSSEVTSETLRTCARTPYAIIHCAGGSSVPASLEAPRLDFQRTVVTTANVLEFIRSSSLETALIYPSSASIYGIVNKLPISETERAAPISPYGFHKWQAEELVRTYSRLYCLRASVVRLFSVYGCGLRKQLLWDACHRIVEGNPIFPGTGDEIRDWLHVEDAARLMVLATQNADSTCPTINGGTGEGICVRDVINEISSHLRPGSARPKFSGTRKEGDPNSFIADVEVANNLGWKQKRHWRDGVKEYVNWWELQQLHELKTVVAASA